MDFYILIAFTAAVILDSLIGDPYSMPHPIRLFGNSIAFVEKHLNKGENRKLKGAVAWLLLVGTTVGCFFILDFILSGYTIAWTIFTAAFIYYGLSARCLIDEGLKVERILNTGDIEGARKQLSMIVGRDTANLNPTQIRSAVVETLSENLSDGVVAPLFFFAIGGVPAMMLYKMINTLDSMVGYKNDRYYHFGYVSAKMDDVANYIPARLTALLMVCVTFSWRGVRFVRKYSNKHSSPNAGYPESALAGIIDCRLGGPNNYFGKLVDKPYIGETDRELTHEDLIKTCCINAAVSVVSYIIITLIILFI